MANKGRRPGRASRSEPDDLVRFGNYFRSLRDQRGLTQAEVAGDRYSAAYISQIEGGGRDPSAEALEYFAARLDVEPEALWSGRPTTWVVELAQALREQGSSPEARRLLQRTLTILDSAGHVRPRVVASVHRELGIAAGVNGDLDDAEKHLRDAAALCERDRATPVLDRIQTLAALGRVLDAKGDTNAALETYRAASEVSLELVERNSSSQPRRAANGSRSAPGTGTATR